jgi:TPR repeat protein
MNNESPLSNRSIFGSLFRGKPSLERADQEYARGRAADAATVWQQLAQQGDAQAQLRLAQSYERGDGVAQSVVEAEHWYRIAAEQDSMAAQAWLGEIYLTGAAAPAFTQDLEKAADWNHRAARAGDAAAQSRLAHQYASGLGLKRDLAAAKHWYEAAADQGDLAGMLGLGLLYAGAYRHARADGEASDHALALEWLERGATANDPTAALCVALLLLHGDGGTADEARALALLEHAAVAGQPAAMFHIGELYRCGRFVERNDTRAASWLRRASEGGYLPGGYLTGGYLQNEYLQSGYLDTGESAAFDLRLELQAAADWLHRVRAQGAGQTPMQARLRTPYHLDTLQLGGPGRPRDPKAARAWYRRCARQGSGAACMVLGIIYATGNAVEKNDTTAARWYAQAAVQGVAEGRYRLALLHLSGNGVAQNITRALLLLQQAADIGHRAAAWALYRLYAEGKQITADPAKAAHWLARAAGWPESVKPESASSSAGYILGTAGPQGGPSRIIRQA